MTCDSCTPRRRRTAAKVSPTQHNTTEADAKTLVRNVAGSAQQRSLVDQIKQMDRFRALYFSSQGAPQGARPKLLALPDFSFRRCRWLTLQLNSVD